MPGLRRPIPANRGAPTRTKRMPEMAMSAGLPSQRVAPIPSRRPGNQPDTRVSARVRLPALRGSVMAASGGPSLVAKRPRIPATPKRRAIKAKAKGRTTFPSQIGKPDSASMGGQITGSPNSSVGSQTSGRRAIKARPPAIPDSASMAVAPARLSRRGRLGLVANLGPSQLLDGLGFAGVIGLHAAG